MEAAAVKKAEDAERERKREAIRKRIEEAKKAQELASQTPATAENKSSNEIVVAKSDIAQRPPQREQPHEEADRQESEEEEEEERPPGRGDREAVAEADMLPNYFEEHLPLPLDDAGVSSPHQGYPSVLTRKLHSV